MLYTLLFCFSYEESLHIYKFDSLKQQHYKEIRQKNKRKKLNAFQMWKKTDRFALLNFVLSDISHRICIRFTCISSVVARAVL